VPLNATMKKEYARGNCDGGHRAAQDQPQRRHPSICDEPTEEADVRHYHDAEPDLQVSDLRLDDVKLGHDQLPLGLKQVYTTMLSAF